MAEKDEAKAGGGKKKLIIIIVAVVALLGGGYFFFLKPGPDDAAAAAAKPTPSHEAGPVLELDPISINLAGGHYLKLGLGLQTSATAGEVSGAKALDAAIKVFSNKTIDELSEEDQREKVKEELVKEVAELYEDAVYDVYFTEFVMQ